MFSPSLSDMPEADAVSVCPTCAVPLIAGAPVAALLGLAAAAAVGVLVRVSWCPLSSVKDTRTLIVLPSSASTSVYVALVPPEMSESLESHW